MRRWTVEAEAYLRRAYPTERAEIVALELRERFDMDASVHSVHTKAFKLGVKRLPRDVPDRAVHTVRWSCEPEMQAWMEANDRGQSLTALSAAFAEEFGFPLSRPQINLWRASNGRSQRRGHGGGRRPRPVGSERDTGKGYVLVKVAERPSRPQSKDNWRMKHVLAWERENGPLPDGMDVWFADGDDSNLDPANLVAVPSSLRARLNSPCTPEWHDAEGLRAAVAWCRLDCAVVSAEKRAPRACAVCGRVFSNEGAPSALRNRQTCPDCRKAGRKARGERTVKGTRACAVCGREFGFTQKNQRRCPDCIAAEKSPGGDPGLCARASAR